MTEERILELIRLSNCNPNWSEVFIWLASRYNAIVTRRKQDGNLWQPYLEAMLRDGVKRPNGQPITTKVVSRTWGHVTRYRKTNPDNDYPIRCQKLEL